METTTKQSKNPLTPQLGAAKKALKKVVIKHHHTKPYRKRHVMSFALCLAAAFIMGAVIMRYNQNIRRSLASAVAFLQGQTVQAPTTIKRIDSTYGFSMSYDSQKMYATASDSSTKQIYVANELHTNRPYDTIRMANSLGEATQASSFTAKYYFQTKLPQSSDLVGAETFVLKDISVGSTVKPKKISTKTVQIAHKDYLQSDWEYAPESTLLSGIKTTFTTFVTTHDGSPFMMQIMHGIGVEQRPTQYSDVIGSVYFGTPTPDVSTHVKQDTAVLENGYDVLDLVTLSAQVHAQTDIPTSQTISSLYSPAVVKVFNIYCQDIYFDNALILKEACNGTTGSGFFINSNGYIASNGHVTSADPKDILIQYAYNNYKKGDTRLLDFLATKQKITGASLPNGSAQERADVLFDLLYDIQSSRITTQNSVQNLLVGIGKDLPDVNELTNLTKLRKEYPEQPTIKRATTISQNFRSIDGFIKFHASDVSIIKIEGSNYPVVKVGTITNLLQGANLNILGYPGNAAQNGIVEAGLSTVTLTSGKVSAIKNALGSDNKLIETDALIGHGNSGGPAFSDTGDVMGISTYTATKVGDSTFNYVRDIGDLENLAALAKVPLNQPSKTQQLWDKAIGQFSSARYSKALANFVAVKAAYPAHPSVDDFIAAAEQNIAQGRDVKDMPLTLFLVILGLLLTAAGALLVMIVKHKKAHNVYKTQVRAGQMDVLQKGDMPVQVHYDPQHIKAQKYVHSMDRN